MNRNTRIGMVVALMVVVGSVLAWKHRERMEARPADPAAAEVNRSASKPSTTAPAVRNLPRLLDLGATKCIPCKMMAPILEELKKEYAGRLTVEFIDVWENRSAKDRYRIRSIPTQIFFDASGKELYRHEGFFSKNDILDKCNELGFNLDKDVRAPTETAAAQG